jgi:5'-methylthioadenosine phosphorylase
VNTPSTSLWPEFSSTKEAGWFIGIVGGSGLYDIPLDDAQQIAVNSPFGAPSGPVTLGRIGHVRVAFMARHGAGHRIPPEGINHRHRFAA